MNVYLVWSGAPVLVFSTREKAEAFAESIRTRFGVLWGASIIVEEKVLDPEFPSLMAAAGGENAEV